MALWCEFLTLCFGLTDGFLLKQIALGLSGGPSLLGELLLAVPAGGWSPAGLFGGGPAVLADTTEPSLLSRIGSQFYIWGSVALGLGLVVFVHELGHFLAAKLFGVKCEKFYVGFDVPISLGPIKLPRTLGKFRYGETEYGIGIIPLGGYVKMLGQDDDPRNMEKESQRIRGEGDADDGEDDEPAGPPPRAALDPRSYPAKSVGQRMVIISAGVVMNVITGVLFAAIAYGLGVEYTPAVIGATSPGDPAYTAGIEPGGRVLAVDGSEPDSQMHFSRMTLKILTHGLADPETPVELTVEYPDGVRQYSVPAASDPFNPEFRKIGVGPPYVARLNKPQPAIDDTPAAEVLSAADAGADILAVDGEPLEENPVLGVTLRDRVANRLITRIDQPVTLTLRRQDEAETVTEVTIPPRRMKTLGFELAPGPVAAVVKEGPAAKAGVQAGDRIIAIEGIDQLSAMQLPAEIRKLDGPVQLTLRDAEGNTREVQIEPVADHSPMPPYSSVTGRIAINSLGLAYLPEPVVASSSAQALQAGDVLSSVTVLWPGGERPEKFDQRHLKLAVERLEEGWNMSDRKMLVSLIHLAQQLPEQTRLRIIAERGPEKAVVDTTVAVHSSEHFYPDRGLVYQPLRRTQQAESLGAALALGLREGKWKMQEVFQFLRLLVTGKVSRNQVGGPLKIADMAASQAERGWAPLLLFLTLLSMNLAILNFLPIPALDGGHMLFLIAEAVMGRPVDEQLQMKLTMGGVLALLSLMIFVFANDILTWQ
ncbi:site-2 protease family protein [Roseimaritima sediminicola]|uniref:site-2 protease family protein n=1 Tax=Roseimaritima sediminicola TaxID=2662066 RepID=UPI001EECF553|nr:site-2 protease family protein [Roseimaritima sediminicola]